MRSHPYQLFALSGPFLSLYTNLLAFLRSNTKKDQLPPGLPGSPDSLLGFTEEVSKSGVYVELGMAADLWEIEVSQAYRVKLLPQKKKKKKSYGVEGRMAFVSSDLHHSQKKPEAASKAGLLSQGWKVETGSPELASQSV